MAIGQKYIYGFFQDQLIDNQARLYAMCKNRGRRSFESITTIFVEMKNPEILCTHVP
jgi:hypothetical protein